MDLCSFVTACRKMSAREEKWKHFWYCFFGGGGGGTGHHHNTYMVSSTHTHTHTHTGTRLHQSCRVFLSRLCRLDTEYYRSQKILLLIFQIAYCYKWHGREGLNNGGKYIQFSGARESGGALQDPL